VALLFAGTAAAQVTYPVQDFTASIAGWTGFTRFTNSSACGGAGSSVRFNLYNFATTANLVSPSLGTSTGGSTTITYDFKAADYAPNTVGSANMGTYNVQYGASASGPWTTFATVSGVAQTGLCLPQSHVFTPPAGALFVRFSASWISGDYYLNFDNIGVTEVPVACSGTPAPGNVTGAPVTACPGASFTLGLQNATGGTGVSYQWYVSTVSNTGPWTAAGTSATLTTSQVVQSWYYCDVTCSTGPATGSSTVAQVDMAPASTFPQNWGGGIINPDCWSATALVGTALPEYNAASGYGVGTGSARWNFFSILNPDQPTLTSPIFAPVGPGTVVQFDVAGVTYTGGEIDTIVLEESNDSGATWTTVVTMTNNPAGGVLNTFGAPGTTTANFVPTAAQWASLNYPVTAGSNRIRFRGISDFGNNVYVDNVNFGVGIPASHTAYGTGCYNVTSQHYYESFTDAAAAETALEGNVLQLIPTNRSHYVGVWLPGVAGTTYVTPVSPANVFATASDDGAFVVNLTNNITTPSGVVTQITVDANGVITFGSELAIGFTPNDPDFAASTKTSFFAWHDFNETESGSGRIKIEETPGTTYVTWDGVENWSVPAAANTSTVQFQIDTATGGVKIVWLVVDNNTTSTYGSGHLVGWHASSAGNANFVILSGLAGETSNESMTAMSLSAGPNPVVGASVNYTTSNIPEFAPGVGLYAQLLFADFGQNLPGLDLVVIGADGCNLHLAALGQQLAGSFSPTPTSVFNIPSIPNFPGFTVYFQAFSLFDPAIPLPNGLNSFGLTSSNAIASYVSTF